MQPIQHWNCEHCKSYNDVLNTHCVICYAYKPDWITSQCQANIEIERGIFIHRIHANGVSMTEQEELFAKFYNHEKILVKDMDASKLREHRDELSHIAFEAKARLVAADDENRERSSKDKKVKDWSLSPTSDQISSDAINNIKTRAARLSKMDKVKRDLLAAGIDEDTVNEMVKNLERKATDKNLKTITFKKQTEEISAVAVKAEKTESNGELFNPANIKFGS